MIERIKIKKTNFTIAWNGEKNDNDPTRFVLWIGETKKGLTENEANLLWNQILSDYMIVNALKNPSEIFSNKKPPLRFSKTAGDLTPDVTHIVIDFAGFVSPFAPVTPFTGKKEDAFIPLLNFLLYPVAEIGLLPGSHFMVRQAFFRHGLLLNLQSGFYLSLGKLRCSCWL